MKMLIGLTVVLFSMSVFASCGDNDRLIDLDSDNLQLVIRAKEGITVGKGMFGGYCFSDCHSKDQASLTLFMKRLQVASQTLNFKAGSSISISRIERGVFAGKDYVTVKLASDVFGTLEGDINSNSTVSDIKRLSRGNLEIICK